MVILTTRYLAASYQDLVRCGNRSGDAQLDRFEGAPDGLSIGSIGWQTQEFVSFFAG
jgi:hypothetical protein